MKQDKQNENNEDFNCITLLPKELVDEIGLEPEMDGGKNETANVLKRGSSKDIYSTNDSILALNPKEIISSNKGTYEFFEQHCSNFPSPKAKTSTIKASKSQVSSLNEKKFNSDKLIPPFNPNFLMNDPIQYVNQINSYHANIIGHPYMNYNLFHAQSKNNKIEEKYCLNLQTEGTLPFYPKNEFSSVNMKQFIIDLSGNFVNFVKTHKGSIFMQKLLDKANEEEIDYVITQTSITELMNDNYGNYFVQKLIQCCSPYQRLYILHQISYKFLGIALNISGTHTVQALIQLMNQPEEFLHLQKIVEPHIMKLSCNSNGTHIIQKILTCFEEKHRSYLTIFIMDNFTKMCLNAHSICVIKKFMNVNINGSIKNIIIKNLEDNLMLIVQDPFGNYAIQHALEVFGPYSCYTIIKIVLRNIVILSTQKYSSNVVEKCIQFSDKETIDFVANEIFYNNANFSLLLKNKFGTFVLNKTVMFMSNNQRFLVGEYLKRYVNLSINQEKIKFIQLLESLQGEF